MALLLASGMACVEPVYEPANDARVCRDCDASSEGGDRSRADASVDARALDGTVSIPPSKPVWPDSMRGVYAIRARFYGTDALVPTVEFTHEKVSLAIVTIEANERVEMAFTTCFDQGRMRTLVPGELVATTKWPERLGAVRFTLIEQDGRFSSQAEARVYGFVDEPPAACATSTTAPSLPEQVWLAGSCVCGATEQPEDINDCRVRDTDNDGQPGVTVEVSGTGSGQDFVRFRDLSRVVNGRMSADGRHSASWLADDSYWQLQCPGVCLRTTYRRCKMDDNLMRFEPLPDSPATGGTWDCAALMKLVNDGSLFANDASVFPSGC